MGNCSLSKLVEVSKMACQKSSSSENPVIVCASGKHTGTLIFLHGLGDTGHGWASSLANIRPSHVKIVCPTASKIAVTLNSGFEMPAWFDLMSLEAEGPEDASGIHKARAYIETLIQKELQCGISPNRIVIGGFSQGGALAIYTGLSTKYNLGGILALSCWMPLNKEFPACMPPGRSDINMLQLHGDIDPVVRHKWGQLTSSTLKTQLKNHEFKTYNGLRHSSSEEELTDIQEFLDRILSVQQ